MSTMTLKDYEAMASKLTFPTNAFIGGKFVPAISGKTMSTENPATGAHIADYAACGKEDVDLSVSIARKVFESGVWSRMHPAERKKILLNFVGLVEKNTVELALLESIDSGKPISECLNVDLPESVHCLQWHAEFADKRYNMLSPSGHNAVGLILQEAIGVVACILPWNFPLMTTAWKIGPALAEGNSVIVKPAGVTTLSMLRLAELGAEAGIPDGVLQVLTGSGRIIGEELGMHNDIDVISFTGSTEVGRQLLACSAKSNLKKMVLELGGKSPMLILDDVEDLAPVVENALAASFWNSGQNCTANSRLIVPTKRKDEFVELMLAGLKESWHVGNPLDPSVNLGPMVSKAHFETVTQYIAKGIAEGGKVVAGGAPLEGLFVPPTIFVDNAPQATIVREEIFGPVTSIIGASSNEEGLRMANESEYGLQASLFTNDLKKAHQYAKAIKAGTVSVNVFCEGDITTPFGGYKLSGFGGRDNAIHAHDQYTETKTIYMNINMDE